MENNETKQKYKEKKVLCYGFVASVAVNLFLFLNNPERPIGTLQAVVGMQIPGYLAMPAIGIAVFIRSILRGKVSSHEWSIEHARDILVQNNNLLKKFLAGIYWLIYYPLLFLVAWILGSALFYVSTLFFT